jgi:hypothetical protein
MEEKNNQTKIGGGDARVIHTYMSDMAESVRNNEMSVIKIAAIEQKKHEKEDIYKEPEGTNKTKLFFIVGGIIILIGASVAIYFVMNKNKETAAPVSNITNTNVQTLVSYDDKSFIDVTSATNSDDLIKLLKPETTKINKPDSVKSIFLTTSTSGTPELLKLEDFVSLINLSAPEPLVRSLSQYMVGTYTPTTETNLNAKPHFFLLFQVKDYNLVYAGMLQWEKTMLSDMHSIFSIDVNSISDNSFKDAVIDNKDGRILVSKTGNVVLYYLFIDNNDLIITDNQDAIKKISTLLIIQNTKPL